MTQKLTKSEKENQNERLPTLYIELFFSSAAGISLLIAMMFSMTTTSLEPLQEFLLMLFSIHVLFFIYLDINEILEIKYTEREED